MSHLKTILQSIRAKDEEAFFKFYAAFHPKSFKKGEMICEIGKISKYIYFIESGKTKHFRHKKDGSEHVVWFNFEGELTVSQESFVLQQPSKYGIIALEDTEILMQSRDSCYEMLAEFHAVETFFRIAYEFNTILLNERIFMLQTQTAKERYQYMFENFPHFFQRLSQKEISSFIGISRETLSRIRK